MYFVLHFNLPVSTNDGTLQIKNAVERGAIGSYQVKNFKTIEEFEADPTTSPSVGSIATHSSTASISPGKGVNQDTSGKIRKYVWHCISYQLTHTSFKLVCVTDGDE